jgi:acetylcholinesterase
VEKKGLYVNVLRPTNTPVTAKLPVVVVSTLFVFVPDNLILTLCISVDIRRWVGTPTTYSLIVFSACMTGGFVTGDASSTDGTPIIQRSVAIGEPIIYVSLNYRLGGGFHSCRDLCLYEHF